MKVAYLLQEADGTSPTGGTPHIQMVCLDKVQAERWKAALPKGSWDYRRVFEIKLYEENNESTKP